MKIPTWIQPEPLEVDVEINVEDITRALEENPDTPAAALQMLNRVAAVMKSTTDEIIAGMKPAQREVVANFLTEQTARFRCENEIAQTRAQLKSKIMDYLDPMDPEYAVKDAKRTLSKEEPLARRSAADCSTSLLTLEMEHKVKRICGNWNNAGDRVQEFVLADFARKLASERDEARLMASDMRTALTKIRDDFEALNGRECDRGCGACIRCIAAEALIDREKTLSASAPTQTP
jgi:hypothetical protein